MSEYLQTLKERLIMIKRILFDFNVVLLSSKKVKRGKNKLLFRHVSAVQEVAFPIFKVGIKRYLNAFEIKSDGFEYAMKHKGMEITVDEKDKGYNVEIKDERIKQ